MQAPYDLTPLLAILAVGALLALAPVAWVWHRAVPVVDPARRAAVRLRALALLTLCLTFDLVLFGAYTRLSDSGLGCPDWPGCYASASPLGAHGEIRAAQAAAPAGPVTPGKAWIEMTHRYLATGVGALITGLAVASWAAHRRGRSAVSPWWSTATWLWVCVQGAFGAWTVTWKLYPAIVTAHLVGALVLLALLAAQHEIGRAAEPEARRRGFTTPRLRTGALLLATLSALQIVLGGWVSTNYAVLACRDFPSCQGSLWPTMDFAAGFAWLRELGRGADGQPLPFAALTAIHYAHRLMAYVVLAGMATFALALNTGAGRGGRRWAQGVSALVVWQIASGLSNVLLGWPLLGALAHTAGAAAWVVLLTTFLVRAYRPMPLERPDRREPSASLEPPPPAATPGAWRPAAGRP